MHLPRWEWMREIFRRKREILRRGDSGLVSTVDWRRRRKKTRRTNKKASTSYGHELDEGEQEEDDDEEVERRNRIDEEAPEAKWK